MLLYQADCFSACDAAIAVTEDVNSHMFRLTGGSFQNFKNIIFLKIKKKVKNEINMMNIVRKIAQTTMIYSCSRWNAFKKATEGTQCECAAS